MDCGMGKVRWFKTAPSTRTLAARRSCMAPRALSRRELFAFSTSTSPSVTAPSTVASLLELIAGVSIKT